MSGETESTSGKIGRRSFLKLAGVAAGGLLLSGCLPKAKEQTSSPSLENELHDEFRDYERLVTWEELVTDLASVNVVCIGEFHDHYKHMQTASALLKDLAGKRKVALAVERFAHTQQPALDALMQRPDKEAAIKEVLAMHEYQEAWTENAELGGRNFREEPRNKTVFEDMVTWSAENNIPIIGLDNTLAERRADADNINRRSSDPNDTLKGDEAEKLKEKLRNEVWVRQVANFRKNHPGYLIVAVGGERHMNSDNDTWFAQLYQEDYPEDKVIQIGQSLEGKTAEDQIKKEARIREQVKKRGLSLAIVKKPQQLKDAFVGTDGSLKPKDYWIAGHQ